VDDGGEIEREIFMSGPIKDIASRFTRRGRSDSSYPLSCHGKLPIYKDYITLEASKGAAEAYKTWMDTGFGAEHADSANVPREGFAPHRILFAPVKGKELAVASLWSSHDAEGLRKFPFSFFISLPKKAVRNLGGEIVARVLPVWRELESYYASLEKIADIGAFYDTFRNSTLDVPAPDREAAESDPQSKWRATSMREVATALFGEQCEAGWGELLSRLETAISYDLESGDAASAFALRIPLAAAFDTAPQVEMWLDLVSANLGGDSGIPTICFPRAGREQNPAVSLLWREPRREDACLLGDAASDYERVEDLCVSAAATEESGDPQCGELARKTLEPDFTTADFSKLVFPR